MSITDAAYNGDLEQVRAFVEQDAALVHAPYSDSGWTPLLYAAHRGHVGVARYLLDQGAAINHRDRLGFTALHWACRSGHGGVSSLLLHRGADVTATGSYGSTPLIDAACHGVDAVVRVFLEHGGSDVDAADDHGWTACHYACIEGHPGVLRQLLAAGADPTLRDRYRSTAKDKAGHKGHQDCIAILQEWERAYGLERVRRVRDASFNSPPAPHPACDSASSAPQHDRCEADRQREG